MSIYQLTRSSIPSDTRSIPSCSRPDRPASSDSTRPRRPPPDTVPDYPRSVLTERSRPHFLGYRDRRVASARRRLSGRMNASATRFPSVLALPSERPAAGLLAGGSESNAGQRRGGSVGWDCLRSTSASEAFLSARWPSSSSTGCSEGLVSASDRGIGCRQTRARGHHEQ
jgi:hypothetical protein